MEPPGDPRAQERCDGEENGLSALDPAALDGDLLSSMVRAIQTTATSLAVVHGKGFYVRANAAAPGVTPHMHWHVLGPGAGADWPGS